MRGPQRLEQRVFPEVVHLGPGGRRLGSLEPAGIDQQISSFSAFCAGSGQTDRRGKDTCRSDDPLHPLPPVQAGNTPVASRVGAKFGGEQFLVGGDELRVGWTGSDDQLGQSQVRVAPQSLAGSGWGRYLDRIRHSDLQSRSNGDGPCDAVFSGERTHSSLQPAIGSVPDLLFEPRLL